jgi:RNA polymerase sigma factor (sigma-70 family)
MDDDEDSPVTALVATAAEGDQAAWNEIVDRYSPLLVSVVRQFRLTAAETEDVAQTVWLRLVEHLGMLSEARALPKWIITTGRREALRHLSTERRAQPHDPAEEAWHVSAAHDPSLDEEILLAERHQVLLAGLAELGARQRQIILLLLEDPPVSYAEISRRTGIPVGAIGPTQARAIERLRRTPSVWAGATAAPDRLGPTAR